MKTLLLILLLLPGVSFAGQWSYQNTCYPNEVSTATAVAKSYPQYSSNYIEVLTAIPSVSLTGLVTESMKITVANTGGYIGPVTDNFQLQPCTDSTGWRPVEVSAVVFYAALMICFFLGVRMGFLI